MRADVVLYNHREESGATVPRMRVEYGGLPHLATMATMARAVCPVSELRQVSRR